MTSPRLLLLGGGSAQLLVLEALATGRVPAAGATLVAPQARLLYPGMVPGYLTGHYAIEDLRIDLRALVRGIGAQFREAAVERIDTEARRVLLDDATSLPYDLVSIAVGGGPAGLEIPGVRQWARLVTPTHHVPALRDAIDQLATTRRPEPLQIVTVGAGAAGVEIALAVRARLDALGARQAIITLLDSSHPLLRDRTPVAQEEAERILRQREITIRLSTAVEEVGQDYVRVTGGRVLPADMVIWTTGVEAPLLFRQSGLPTDPRGYLLVDGHLAVPGCPGLFGAGDAVTLESHPRTPRAGVFAVRQGPVLARNLGGALRALAGAAGTGRKPVRYTPEPRALALLNTGDGRAVLSLGSLAWTSRFGLWLKDRLDLRFVRRFQRIERGTPPILLS